MTRPLPQHRPQRIQRKRTKGWKMPPGVVYVGRGSAFGNPYRLGDQVTIAGATFTINNRHQAVGLFRTWFRESRDATACEMRARTRRELRGKTLACWCPVDGDPCHADVLLETANGSEPGAARPRGAEVADGR